MDAAFLQERRTDYLPRGQASGDPLLLQRNLQRGGHSDGQQKIGNARKIAKYIKNGKESYLDLLAFGKLYQSFFAGFTAK